MIRNDAWLPIPDDLSELECPAGTGYQLDGGVVHTMLDGHVTRWEGGAPADAFQIRSVHPARVAEVRERVARLARRAVKLGAQPPRVVVGETYAVERRDWDPLGRPFVRRELVTDVAFWGPAPRVAGWEFVATVEPGAGGAMIRSVPTAALAPRELDGFRDADPNHCDHCGKTRRRSNVYVLRRTTEPTNPGRPDQPPGTLVQVGRTCLRDFTGADDPAKAANFALTAGGDLWDGTGGGEPAWTLEHVVACAAASVAARGYVPTREPGSTREDVRGRLTPPGAGASEQTWREWRDSQPVDADFVVARRLLWHAAVALKNAADLSGFEHNVAVLLRRGEVTDRNLGYAVAVLPFARRFLETARQAEASRNPSRHQGTIGERVRDIPVTISRCVSFDSENMGTRWILSVADEAGNVLTWFTSRLPRKGKCGEVLSYEPGSRLLITGTVASHDEYRGVEETRLSRCLLRSA